VARTVNRATSRGHRSRKVPARVQGRAVIKGVRVRVDETGETSFARALTKELHTAWVAPGDAVHSFEAAGYVHRVFFEHFLAGETWSRAFRKTSKATEDYSTTFRCWLNGEEVLPVNA
jgi:hypothetical protein